jgi:hypothetical protein
MKRTLIALLGTIIFACIFFGNLLILGFIATTLDKYGYFPHLLITAIALWFFSIFMGIYKSIER